MADSAVALLEAVQALLRNAPAVQTLCEERVYGAVPDDVILPYVRIGCSSEPWSTQTFEGMKHTLRVQAFSDDGKPGVPLALRSAAYLLLNRQEHAVVLPDDLKLIQIEHEGVSDCFPEDDGKTYQSVIEFQCSIQ